MLSALVFPTLFTGEWRPLNLGLLLRLDRELFAYTELAGGEFTSDDNLVVDQSPDGSVGRTEARQWLSRCPDVSQICHKTLQNGATP